MSLPPLEFPAARSYRVLVRAADGRVEAPLSGWRTLNVVIRRRDVGSITVTMPADSPAIELLGPGSGLVVTENGKPIASGRYDHPHATMGEGADPFPGTLTVATPDDLVDLRDRVIYANAGLGWAQQTATVQTLHGPAETLALHWIRQNTGTAALLPARRTRLIVPDTQARGRVVKRTVANGENLLTVAQEVLGPDSFGMRAVQGENGPVLALTRSVDRSADVFFAYGRNNLAGWDITQSCSDGNAVLGAGGEGATRKHRERVNSDSVARWGRRVELFLDERQTTDEDELTSALESAAADHPDVSDLSLNVLDTAQMQFGRDFFLGDIVGVRIGADQMALPVEEAQITVAANGEQRRTVTLGALPTGPRDRRMRTISGVLTRVRKLETRI